MTLQDNADGGLTAAEVEHVAAAGNIPNEHLEYLAYWLEVLVFRYIDEIGMYARCQTRKQRRDHIAEINEKALDLQKLLDPVWVGHLMAHHEVLPLLSGSADPPPQKMDSKVEQVRRDILGVEALVRRSAAMHRQLESQPRNVEEKIAARNAAKPALHELHCRIRDFWTSIGRKPQFSEGSEFVAFVRAIYGLIDLDDHAACDSIRSTHNRAVQSKMVATQR